MLPKTNAYAKIYDGDTGWMYFFIEHDDLFKRYHGIQNRVSNNIKKELDCQPTYNRKFLKTKIRSYSDEAKNFYNKEVPKVASNYTCVAVISLDSVFKKE